MNYELPNNRKPFCIQIYYKIQTYNMINKSPRKMNSWWFQNTWKFFKYNITI